MLENLQQQLDKALKREGEQEDELTHLRARLAERVLEKEPRGNRYVEEVQHRLQALQGENEGLRGAVESLEEELRVEKSKDKEATAVSSFKHKQAGEGEGGLVKVLQDRLKVQETELLGLREQRTDHVEQIEVSPTRADGSCSIPG